MAIEEAGQQFRPPPLPPPTVPVAQRAEALRSRINFERIRASALGQAERAQRLESLQATITPRERELIVPAEELERIERIADIEAVPPPQEIPEGLRQLRRVSEFVTRQPREFISRLGAGPEALEALGEQRVTVTREEAVRRLREFAPDLTEEAAESLVTRPKALERFVELQQRERPKARLQFGIGARLQALEEAGEVVGIPRTREEVTPVVETLKEFALDVTPVIGTQRQVEGLRRNWDQLSDSDRALGVGLTAVSALGDAVLAIGPAKLSLKLLKGSRGQKSKVAQTLITSEADEAAGLLRSTVGRRADAVDEVRSIAKELEQLESELTRLRAPTGETPVQTAFAKRNIENIPESENIPQAVERAIGTLDEVKKTPIIQQREQDFSQITGMQDRLRGLTDDLVSGQKTPVEFRITAGTGGDLREIEQGFTKIVDTPGSIKGTEKVVIESPASREGIRALLETDDVIQRARAGRPILPEEVEEFTNLQSRLKDLRESTTIQGPRGVPITSESALARLREFEETALPRIRELRHKSEVQSLLDRKLSSELVIEKGPSAAALRQSQAELRGIVDVDKSIENLITSKNPTRDSQSILNTLTLRQRTRLERAPLTEKELQVVQKAEREIRTFAEQQQEAVQLAEDMANTLQNANVRSINLKAVVREGSSSDLESLAEFLVRERGEGNLTDITNLIRVKQARGEDVTDLLTRQGEIRSKIQQEVSGLSQTFGTQDPEAATRFANLFQDSLESRRITSSLEVENIGSALRPLSETEIRELANLESTLKELREAATITGPRGVRTTATSGPSLESLQEFEKANLARLNELRSRPQIEVTPDVRSIKLEPKPAKGLPTQATGPGLFGRPTGPPLTGGTLGGFVGPRGGVAVVERPVSAISIEAPIGAAGPRLEVVTTLRTLRQPEALIPIAGTIPFGIVEAPERPAPDIIVEPEVAPEVAPQPERRPSVPRRAPIGPPRREPEPGITEPEVTPRRREVPPERVPVGPPVREPVPEVTPLPGREPEPGVPPGFIPVPTPPIITPVRVVPSPLALPLEFIEPEVGRAIPEEGVEVLPLTGIFPEIKTGIDQPTPVRPRVVPEERPRPKPIPSEFPRIQPLPSIGPTILPEEQVITEFEPELFTPVEPLPEIVPEVVPEERPEVPIRPRIPEVPRVPETPPRRLPRRRGEAEEVREIRRPGRPRAQGVAWKQGEIWISIFPPFGQEDIIHSRAPLPNTRRVRNPRQAFKFVEDRTGFVAAETYDEWATWFAASPSSGETVVF